MFYSFINSIGEKETDVFPFSQTFAYERGTYIEQGSFGHSHLWGQFFGIDVESGAWIDDEFVFCNQSLRLGPQVEYFPVVAADDEVKFPVGIGLFNSRNVLTV